MPEFLLLFDAGESRSEFLSIGTVASSVMCEFNHPVAESFKTTWICAEAACCPSNGFAVKEKEGVFGFWMGGKKEITMLS